MTGQLMGQEVGGALHEPNGNNSHKSNSKAVENFA